MRNLLFVIFTLSILFNSCRNTDSALPCNEITPGVAFEAQVHDTWCLPEESLKVTIRTIVEDSRCVKNVLCSWEGYTVFEFFIETQSAPSYRDTLHAFMGLFGEMTIGNYSLKINQVLPLERNDFVIDTAEYRFQLVLNEE